MEIPEQIKEKIRSLSLKTISNGATESEQIAAKQMISRLLEKYSTVSNYETSSISISNAMNVYRSYRTDHSLKDKRHEVDWDEIAKQILVNKDDYYHYLHETHKWWDQFEKSKCGLIEKHHKAYISESIYRLKCFEVLRKIKDEV